MTNDKYIQNRKIVYQCSYCGTQYINADTCPACHATTAASTVLADNLDTMLTTDLEQQRSEVVKKGARSAYLTFTIIHMCSCAALVGFLVSPLMLLIHLVYHIAKRKKPHPVVIIDGGFCLLLTIILIIVLPDILS